MLQEEKAAYNVAAKHLLSKYEHTRVEDSLKKFIRDVNFYFVLDKHVLDCIWNRYFDREKVTVKLGYLTYLKVISI